MTSNVPVIQSNPNPIRNPNTNAEDAGEAPASHSPAEKRHQYGEYGNVLLSDTDMEKLKAEFPTDWQARIENLSSYMASKGVSYKNHLATIRNWARKDREKTPQKASGLPDGNSALEEKESVKNLQAFLAELKGGER